MFLKAHEENRRKINMEKKNALKAAPQENENIKTETLKKI
jgi:hypothetical protein